jgi:hypothetical protein
MRDNERTDDARFAEDILKGLPTAAVPAGLEARILADFDRVRPGRRSAFLARLGERLWPGAPAWQPASVLALSLAIGLMAGTFVPSPTVTTDQVITALDTTPDMDLDRDP